MQAIPVSATLRMDRVDSVALQTVRAMPGIAAVRARRVVSASASSSGGEALAQLFVLGDFEARDIAAVDAVSGTWPPRDGEIVIEKSSLQLSGAVIGDLMTLRYAGGFRAIAIGVRRCSRRRTRPGMDGARGVWIRHRADP